MNHKSLKRHRAAAFAAQGGLCFYCGKPMWQGDCAAFAREHGLTMRQARRRQCTAEHLIARKDGGRESASNIVAACRSCNQTRHRRRLPPPPLRWRSIQRGRCGVTA